MLGSLVALGGIAAVTLPRGPVPSAVWAVQQGVPGLVDNIESKGHKCRWTVRDVGQPGREGWKVVQCFLDGGETGPAWYLSPVRAVYAQNQAARDWSDAPRPPDVSAWSRPGTACSLSVYYDDCMANIVIDEVRRVSGGNLASLQTIADQTLGFDAGHSKDVAEKIKACGEASYESRCGAFARETRAVQGEVLKQIAAQRSK